MLLNEGVKVCVLDREKRIWECVGLSPDIMLRKEPCHLGQSLISLSVLSL